LMRNFGQFWIGNEVEKRNAKPQDQEKINEVTKQDSHYLTIAVCTIFEC